MTVDTLCVIGLGYIGLPTAALFASRKINVIGVDTNSSVVNTINSGKAHFIEPELDTAVHDTVSRGYLRATTEIELADAYIIAVPTPVKDNHAADLSFVKDAVMTLAPVLRVGNLVILESTCPVGTTLEVALWLAQARPDLRFPSDDDDAEEFDVFIAHCPERVLPGRAMRELVSNDRVVGGISKSCARNAKELYEHIIEGECVLTDARTAEMAKLTENAFRDVNIAFANELSMICNHLDINVWELIRLANRHPRVDILKPGPGVGGHCIAVDPWYIVHSAPHLSNLISTARTVNNDKPNHIISDIKRAAAKHQDAVIACLGLSFKANVDDLRESPALKIVSELLETTENTVVVCEPNLTGIPVSLSRYKNLKWVTQPMDAVRQADVVAALVKHKQFEDVKLTSISNKNVIDACGLWGDKN